VGQLPVVGLASRRYNSFQMKRILTVGLLVFALQILVPAQDRGLNPVDEAVFPIPDPGRTPRHLALVIGNWQYGDSELPNARNDELAVAAVLEVAHGYEVSRYENLTRVSLPDVVDRFVGSVAPGDTVVVYYAGHGAQVGHHNYLIPVDYDGKSAAELMRESYDVELLHSKLAARARQRILILDACRNNPFAHENPGLAAMEAQPGTLIMFAANSGATADENSKGQHGLFTEALLRDMAPGMDATVLAHSVQQDVVTESAGRQWPVYSSELYGDFPLISSNIPNQELQVAIRGSGIQAGTSAVEVAKVRPPIVEGPEEYKRTARFFLSAGSAAPQDDLNREPTSAFVRDLVAQLKLATEGRLLTIAELAGALSRVPQSPTSTPPILGGFGSNEAGSVFLFPSRRLHALVFATDQYAYLSPMRGSIADASAFAEQLRTMGATVDFVANPTRNGILEKLDDARERLHEDDELIVFVAGHAAYNPRTRETFLMARDTRLDALLPTAIQLSSVARVLDRLPSRHVLLILDAQFKSAENVR